MKILLLAGEESGLLYAGGIRAEILKICPDAEFRGYGDCGFKTADLAVMGFWQVLKRIGYFLRVKRTMERTIREWRPDAVVTVDYPGMNLKLAAYAKSLGIRTVHVVCPQVWAWKRGRIPSIEASLDRLCCFFPFEPQLFKPGFAEFVGHPLAAEFAALPPVVPDGGGKVVAMLPGSRMGEIELHLPELIETADRLRDWARSRGMDLRIVVPAANARARREIVRRLAASRLPEGAVEVLDGGARETLRRADAAVVASGTATLEAALAGCPTVLVYRVGWLLARIARVLIKGISHIGLANIIAEKSGRPCPMPELLQENFTADAVLEHLRLWLDDEDANRRARQALADTVALLQSGRGGLVRIAEIVTDDPQPLSAPTAAAVNQD